MNLSPTTALRAAALLLLSAGSLVWSGCSTTSVSAVAMPLEAVAKYSPAPQTVSGIEALEGAQDYVAKHKSAGADYMIGSGDSMLPLYHDRAVVVTERPALESLKVGQTVVFMGANGPVAHVIVQQTSRGWVTMGLGNREADDGTVTEEAYIGVVVKAYQPTSSAMLAYVKTASKGLYASNP